MITRIRVTSIRNVLLSIITVLAVARIGYADQITIRSASDDIIDPPDFLTIVLGTGGPTSFVFENPFVLDEATDFHIFAVNVLMGGASGGPPFPVTHIPLPCFAAGGGFSCVTFDGGPGIGLDGRYSFSFTGFPDGATFHVTFSTVADGEILFAAPILVLSGSFPTTGSVSAVPEPTTMLLLSTGLAGVAIKTRKRLKRRKRGKEANSCLAVNLRNLEGRH